MGKGGSGEEGGKSQLGVNHLILEETPGHGAIICTPKEAETTTKTGSQLMPSDLIVAVDPFETKYFEIVFNVREMLVNEKDRVLLLLYSQELTQSPQIPTPKSINKFQLDLARCEVLGLYDIPAQSMFATNATRIGQANPASRSIVSLSVNLDTNILPVYMKKSGKSIYLQAALLSRSDLDAGNFETMILSEVDVISFVEMECPEDRHGFAESANSATVTFTK
jgi:hypothetical protein